MPPTQPVVLVPDVASPRSFLPRLGPLGSATYLQLFRKVRLQLPHLRRRDELDVPLRGVPLRVIVVVGLRLVELGVRLDHGYDRAGKGASVIELPHVRSV